MNIIAILVVSLIKMSSISSFESPDKSY